MAPDHDAGSWRRLDPRMLLVHPVREVGRFLPAVIGAAFAGRSLGEEERQWIFPVVATAVVMAIGVVRWLTTRYRFTPDQVQLRTGLVKRTTHAASPDKVRTVDVTASVLYRLLGLASVEIGTAAGTKEFTLDGLPAKEAASLRTELLHRRTGTAPVPQDLADTGQPEVHPAPEPDDVLYRLEPKWLAYAPLGLTGFITASVVIGFVFQVIDQLGLWPQDGSSVSEAWSNVEDLGVVAIVLVLALGILVVVSVLAVVGAALAYYGFTLKRDRGGRTLHIARGLATTRATSLEIRRVRGVELRRPIPLRWFGGARLNAVTTGLGAASPEHGQSDLLAPASPLARVQALGDDVLGRAVFTGLLVPHGPVAMRRRMVRAVVPASVLAAALAVAGSWFARPIPAGAGAIVVVLLGVLLGRSRAHHLGHAIDGDHLITQSGSITLSRTAIDLDATAAVTVRRSFFQRRAGVASVEVALGAGRQGYTITDLVGDYADELAGVVLGHARSSTHRDLSQAAPTAPQSRSVPSAGRITTNSATTSEGPTARRE